MSPDKRARSYTNLGRAILRFPKAPWDDALSHGQMQSKAWAISELVKLKQDLGLVYILGGWLGTLAFLMFEEPRLQVRKIRSFDIDPTCEPIADQVNVDNVIAEWRFKAVTKDMFGLYYGSNHRYTINVRGKKPAGQVDTCQTIINTSCDHIGNFARWWAMIPKGKLVLLQNNNFKANQHVNTVANLNHMLKQAPMTRLLYKGSLDLMQYRRFMLIGVK